MFIKKVFFNRYKQKIVIKYKKIFLKKVKLLLLYFDDFKIDGKILLKEYLNNCIIKGLD